MAAKKKPTKKPTKGARPRRSAPAKGASAKKSARKVASRSSRRSTKPKAPAKRTAASKRTARPSKGKAVRPAQSTVARREHGGHFDPQYVRDLLAQSGRPEPEPRSFVEDPRAADDLAEGLGEEFVEEVTSGENEGADRQDQVVTEERGGPFVVTTAGQEFAEGIDASNPKGARREPFPKT